MIKKNSGNYRKLKRRIFLQMFIITFVACISVVILRSLTFGKLGNGIMSFLVNNLGYSYYGADYIYQEVVRNNMNTIYLFTIIVFMLVLLYFSINWFTKYFDEIIRGVEVLALDNAEEIHLSKELGFMEKKLNQIKDTLAAKTRAAHEAEQRKNDLVVYLAHDIKTPLTSVVGYLNLLEDSADLSIEERSKYVGIAMKKAYRLEELIDEFFEITRFNLQSVVLDKANLNIDFMLQQLADEFYPQLAARGQNIVFNLEEGLCFYGDGPKLARVFNNLLKNAISYSDVNSDIVISAGVEAENVEVSFGNYGRTLRPKELTAIFEKFYRLDSARSSNTGGSGLGLAIAREIVTAHGGTIAAKSQDGFTVFTVKLQLSEMTEA